MARTKQTSRRVPKDNATPSTVNEGDDGSDYNGSTDTKSEHNGTPEPPQDEENEATKPKTKPKPKEPRAGNGQGGSDKTIYFPRTDGLHRAFLTACKVGLDKPSKGPTAV